ncbi:hypothetical protein BOX15_Mlig023425g2 [Macrostomum lignano]|uniref:Wolframin n=2 Tax=Macrostomum lignano TaxID=282301 RepID=A0A267H962_9PLAT|nr:hypothetical protein BOX15_Mlig023425g2 [Macrostomum lignano]
MSDPVVNLKRTASVHSMPSGNATAAATPDSPSRTPPLIDGAQQPRPKTGRQHSTADSHCDPAAAAARRLSYPAQSFDDVAAASGGADRSASDDAIDRLFTSNSFDELVNSLHGLLAAHPTEQEISRERVIESLREASSYTSSEFLLADTAGLRQPAAAAAAQSGSVLRKLIDFPSTFIDQALEVAARQGGYWIMSLLPIHEVVTLMLLLIFRWLNVEFLQQLGWLVLFYCGLACMLTCSFRVLHALVTDRRRGKPLRRAVKRLLKDASAEERSTAVRRLGRRRHQAALSGNSVGCLVACLCAAAGYGLCSHVLVPASEMLMLSCLMALLLLVYGGGGNRFRWIKLCFLLTSLYSGLPALLGPGLPSNRLPSWLCWTVASAAEVPLPAVFSLAPQLRLSLSLPAAAKLGSLACLASLLPCRCAIPCLLAAAWWHFGLLFASEVTFGGILRLASGVGLAFVAPMALPLLLLYILAVVLAHTPAVLFVYLWQAGGLLLLLLLSVIMIYGVQNGLTIGRTNLKQDYPTLYRAGLAAFFTACCLIPFVFYWLRVEPVATSESTRSILPSLTYEQFSQVCCQRGWSCHNNRVEAQAVCAHLEGVRVYWQGTVRGVAIGRTDNKMKDFVKFLPAFLHRLFACTYGRPYMCDNATVARFGPILCEALAEQKACHLEDYNDHTYHITVSPKLRYPNASLSTQKAQVVLLAPSSLSDQARLLTAGHRVRFSGVIEDTLSDPARVRLRSLDCSNCVWTLRPGKAASKAAKMAAAAAAASSSASSGAAPPPVDVDDDDDDDDDDWSWSRLLARVTSFCFQPLLLVG